MKWNVRSDQDNDSKYANVAGTALTNSPNENNEYLTSLLINPNLTHFSDASLIFRRQNQFRRKKRCQAIKIAYEITIERKLQSVVKGLLSFLWKNSGT